jgi:hypothetical protein
MRFFPNGHLVAVFGAAGGTIAKNGELPPENKWRITAAWLAVVENGLVKEWRVYADNKPVYEIMRSRSLNRDVSWRLPGWRGFLASGEGACCIAIFSCAAESTWA